MPPIGYRVKIEMNPNPNSSINICGFWFHIEWFGKRGIDQHGNIWVNPENPEAEDSEMMDRVLDQVNDLKSKLSI